VASRSTPPKRYTAWVSRSKALDRLFAIKGRDAQSVLLIAADREQLSDTVAGRSEAALTWWKHLAWPLGLVSPRPACARYRHRGQPGHMRAMSWTDRREALCRVGRLRRQAPISPAKRHTTLVGFTLDGVDVGWQHRPAARPCMMCKRARGA
jgi:hypothetical protein